MPKQRKGPKKVSATTPLKKAQAGRVEKSAQRASSRIAKKVVNINVKNKLKVEAGLTKELSMNIREEDKAKKEAKRTREKANKEKKEANAKKALLAQNKKNFPKLKKVVQGRAGKGGKKK